MRVKYPFTYFCYLLFAAATVRGMLLNSGVTLEIKIVSSLALAAFTCFVAYCQEYLDQLDEQARMRF